MPTPAPQLAESELIKHVLAGRRQYFHDLIRPYERTVYVIALAMLANPSDAEEAAQETFLKALLNLHQLAEPARFKAWLLQIATNEARLKLRARRGAIFQSIEQGEDSSEDGFMPRDFADWRDLPSDVLERAEIRRAVAEALKKLPEIYREVFVLRDIQEMSIAECCQALGISTETVKVRLHRARLRMREEMAPAFHRNWLGRLFSFKGKKPW